MLLLETLRRAFVMDRNLNSIIYQLLNQYGIDILLNGNRFCALVDDLAPDPALKIERRVLQRLNQENLLSEVHQVISQNERDSECYKLDLLLEEAGFSETWKQIVFELFQFKNKAENRQEEIKQKNPSGNCYPEGRQLDQELKKFIQEVVRSVSGSGPIIVEESLKTYTNWEHMSGMKLDRGFISPYMVQNEDKGETVLEDPLILITNLIITKEQTITDIMNLVVPVAKSLLIISTDIEDKALRELINRVADFPCVAIKAPAYGERRIEILKDIAILTGGTAMLSNEESVRNLSIDTFGQASKVFVRSEDTIIINGQGRDDSLSRRIEQIQDAYHTSYSDYDREKLQERIENLKHGVAVIRVGGRKVSEIKQQMDMIENAVELVRQEEIAKLHMEEKR